MVPARCLFKELEISQSNSFQDTDRRKKCKQEADHACARSVELLRLRYNFDVVQMTPLESRDQMDKENTVGVASTHTGRRCVSCGSFLADEWLNLTPQKWNWQSVPLETEYVPTFYHPRRSYSDGCIRSDSGQVTGRLTGSSVPVEPHPSPRDSVALASLSETHSPQKRSLNSKCVQVTIPLTVYDWGARIRRNSNVTFPDKVTNPCGNKLESHTPKKNHASDSVSDVSIGVSSASKVFPYEQIHGNYKTATQFSNPAGVVVHNLAVKSEKAVRQQSFTQLSSVHALTTSEFYRPTARLRQMKLSGERCLFSQQVSFCTIIVFTQ